MIDFLNNHPFVFGLLVGLLAALGVWVRGVFVGMGHRRELERLRGLLHTKLEVEARGHKLLSDELDSLRRQNENLRITVQALQQRPDRAELRALHVYDLAVRTLLARSPGFGPAWQTVLDEAEQKVTETETGFGAFVRRVFGTRPVRALPEDASEPDKGNAPDES